MGKPIINKIIPFDAKNDYTFSFSYSGNQPYKNKIRICNAATNAVVKEETITSMKYTHVLSANSLVNGMSYTVQISVFDINNVESSLSDKVLFTCYTTPVFEFTGLNKTAQNNIKYASYSATVSYTQAESRQIKSYKFYLYDSTQKIIKESDIQNYYPQSAISYVFRGLSNDALYHIRCTGTTVDGINVDTGYIKIYTDYNISNLYSTFHLENKKYGGYVFGSTNIVSVNGVPIGEYEIVNGSVLIPESSISYTEGFLIDKNFVIEIVGKNFSENETILELDNGNHKIILKYMNYEGKHYLKLDVNNGLTHYILYSDRFLYTKDKKMAIAIKKVDDLYQLKKIIES